MEQTYTQLQETALGEGAGDSSVKVDYDMWYPFQWYVRHEAEEGSLRFDRFCAASASENEDEDEDDMKKDCRAVGEDSGPQIYLAEHGHAVDGEDAPGYRKEGPMKTCYGILKLTVAREKPVPTPDCGSNWKRTRLSSEMRLPTPINSEKRWNTSSRAASRVTGIPRAITNTRGNRSLMTEADE